MNRSLVDKLKKYAVSGIVVIPSVFAFSTIYSNLAENSAELTKLENSRYIYNESRGSLYGYDDNNDGQVDRIEELGTIVLRMAAPAFRIRITHLPTDRDYPWYASRLAKLGTQR